MSRSDHALWLCAAAVLVVVFPLCVAPSASASTVVGTWIRLSIDASTAPTSGWCDSWSGVDHSVQRVLLIGGDGGGGEDTVVQGLWALDYSTSLETPTWHSLSANRSDAASIDAPAVGEGSHGGLRPRCASTTSTNSSSCAAGVSITLYGGHSTTSNAFLNATDTALVDPPNVSDSATWYPTISDDAAAASLLPAIAWGTASWADAAQTRLLLYGGTRGDTGLDSADLWLLDLNASTPAWVNVTAATSGDYPPKLSGARMRFDDSTGLLVMMGGYSCTVGAVSGEEGGVSCFSNSVWLLDPVSYVWTGFHDPNPGPASTWPLPRAWHSTVLYGSQLWVFGGQYVDASLTVYYWNDVAVWDLQLQAWQTVAVKGVVPPVMWSQTANLVQSPTDGLHHMLIIAGCTSSAYYSDVYALKLNTAVQADNCQAVGPGLINATAGALSSFGIQARQRANATGNGTGSDWGEVLTWGVQLQFDVLVIGELGGVPARLESGITEVGSGVYEVWYTAFGGASACGQVTEATVTISIQLDGMSVPGAPFIVQVLPAALNASKATITDPTDAVREQPTTFTVHPADAYGNPSQGLLTPTRLTVLVDAQPPDDLVVTSRVSGEYEVSYRPPSAAVYELSVLFDGEDVPGSPFSVAPLANLAISQGQQLGVQVTASVVSLLLLIGAALVIKERASPVMKAASPTFTLLILAGCQVALSSCLIPVASSLSSDCTAYCWTLSVGCTLVFSSLNAKAWRVSKIFHANTARRGNTLRVVRIRDSVLVLPVVAAVACEMVFNALWVALDPLRATDEVSSSNSLLHYIACESRHETVWYALELGMKGALLLYGVSLASQVRKVPAAFNDSQWIAWSTYNIVGCGIAALAIVLLFSATPSAAYIVRSLAVIWCTLVTAGLMLLPKLIAHALHQPLPTGLQEGSGFSKPAFHVPTTGTPKRGLSTIDVLGLGRTNSTVARSLVIATEARATSAAVGPQPLEVLSPTLPMMELVPAPGLGRVLSARSHHSTRVGPAPAMSSPQSAAAAATRTAAGAWGGHSPTESRSTSPAVRSGAASIAELAAGPLSAAAVAEQSGE